MLLHRLCINISQSSIHRNDKLSPNKLRKLLH